MLNINFTSTEEGMEKLRKYVSIRNTMGGALYWNIVNDDCLRLANALCLAGTDRNEIESILNK